ncbi:DUF4178 domain-containing protein [Desertibacillus haloalkaliphilus]|uniref:DUF4178 domain-containing protein n=1 Tax=Desertibacillus haloalkaliphilus TaxID=1328930 RepID=UPI001C26833B|nr:DUF4178 domain-containing protein [Desertibacillus haloalkaliphilus]MBU8908946.1 DUF4178 domain-containing protein [Desertibacillus haloalkaliphilus]
MSFLRRLFRSKQQDEPVKERTVMNIQVDDIITYDLEDYQVVSKLTYNDHGFEWTAYQLQGNKTLWLSVEMDDELHVGMYEKITKKLNDPLPERVEHEGVTYYLDESGTAHVRGEGRGANVNGRECHYFEYCNDNEDRFLSVEIWGSEVEVSYGYPIEDYELKILASH